MPYTTELPDDYMGVHHSGTGRVTGAEILEGCRVTTQLLQNTENFHYEFIDFTDATEIDISADELDRIIAQDFYAAIFRPDAVIVVVAPENDHFQIVQQWEMRVKGIGWLTHIARERGAAWQWLRANYPNPSAPTASTEEAVSTPGEPPAIA